MESEQGLKGKDGEMRAKGWRKGSESTLGKL